MIKIERTQVFNFEGAIRGARNPMNSWKRSDSYYDESGNYVIGENDLTLMRNLCKAGSDHRKLMRQIFISVDITAPLYWWKEFDTYKVGTVANSCSTMHKLHDKEFTIDDFSHEHLEGYFLSNLYETIALLNVARKDFVELKIKRDWWQMIQLLPSSYNQMRTVTLNYEVVLNMYHARKNHKLDEWHTLCDWITELPYFKEICLNDEKGENE